MFELFLKEKNLNSVSYFIIIFHKRLVFSKEGSFVLLKQKGSRHALAEKNNSHTSRFFYYLFLLSYCLMDANQNNSFNISNVRFWKDICFLKLINKSLSALGFLIKFDHKSNTHFPSSCVLQLSVIA